MNPLLHPIFVHFPLAISFITPLLVLWALIQFKKNPDSANQLWTMVVIPLTIMAVFSALAVLAGERAHHVLHKYMDHKPIETHEDIAEVFAMVVYITAALSYFIFMFKEQRRFLFMIAIMILSIILMGMAMVTGKTGGEIVHKYDAPQYMNKAIKDGALNKKQTDQDKSDDEDDDD